MKNWEMKKILKRQNGPICQPARKSPTSSSSWPIHSSEAQSSLRLDTSRDNKTVYAEDMAGDSRAAVKCGSQER